MFFATFMCFTNNTTVAWNQACIFVHCHLISQIVGFLIKYSFSHVFLLTHLLMIPCNNQFEGCSWDFGTKSSAGCCCSCTGKLLCIWLSSIVLISGVWTIMHVLYFRQNFQCQRFRKPSMSLGIVIYQSLQRCVIMSLFSSIEAKYVFN